MTMINLHRIIQHLRERRLHLGYSQRHLADKLDISRSAYNDVEVGNTTLSVERLLTLCNILQLSPAALFKGESWYATDFGKLFYGSDEPMWLFEPFSLGFLEVNDAAVRNYGFSRADFMTMTIADIRPEEDAPVLKANLVDLHGDKTWHQPVRHWHRDQTIKNVRISCYQVDHHNKLSYLCRPQTVAVPNRTNDILSELRILSAQLETDISASKRENIIEKMCELLKQSQ